ncbi:mycothiol synthase [Phycicoccus sp. Soil748]|uniref:mycothiol synthase n=1 Tax=Intrasporangiaceae TaxID=85021 RepID=UPI001F2181F0|nr:mycothiol synthase [Phycicoccus sp. Soil748]
MPSSQICRSDTLTDPERAQVRELQRRATSEDGVRPLSEQTELALAAGPGEVRHYLVVEDGAGGQATVQAYAQLDDAAAPDASGELVVDPAARRRGLGTALAEAVLADAPAARLWSHGQLPGATALAHRLRLQAVRELHKMARPLTPADLDPAAVALPEGFRARTFEPGRDEEPWLATNAAAFAQHPEQGRMTLADLQDRMAQPWFDAAGFVIVTADDAPDDAPDEVAAFHWTKVDPDTPTVGRAHGGEGREASHSAGEVYVVGVHPRYQGRGLGRPLTALGLAHLASLGLEEVDLYVDGDNHAAIHTYTALGFRSIMVDVMYSHAVHEPLSG